MNLGVIIRNICWIHWWCNYCHQEYISQSKYEDNRAELCGAIKFFAENSIITITGNVSFINNTASEGGVLCSNRSFITINASTFNNNLADNEGGVLLSFHGFVTIEASEFHNSGNLSFSNNFGSITAYNSNMTFRGYADFVKYPRVANIQTGGAAITLFQSNIYIDGECNLEHNHAAGDGGAVFSIHSKLYVNGNVTIAHNTATRNGGGVHLLNSELNSQQESTIVFYKNTAVNKGGGLHAVTSLIKATSILRYLSHGDQYIGTRINFTNNVAKFGGGL